jgi:hypothetical protein
MQSSSQVRVVDPILSRHARGYRQPGLVGAALFPLAPVQAYAGQVIQFGKESFRLYNSKRAPGSNTKRIEYGYAGEPYAIVPSALEAKVPREHMRDAAAVPGIDLGGRAVNTVMRALLLEHEVACATLATTAANFGTDHKVALVGADRWTGGSSDPSEDVETGKEAIRASIGVYPNVAVVSAKALSACRFNAKILDRLRYTSSATPTAEILAALWGIQKVVIAGAVAATGATDAFGDVWGTHVVLGYANENGGDANANIDEPSCGYTYLIDGMPMVEQPYYDNNAKSWIYGVSHDNTPVASGMTAMYLIENAGAPAA